jgi:serine protease SohB
LNFYRILKDKGVDSVTLTAGVDKAPLTSLSEITEEGVEKTSEMLADVHSIFKDHVSTHRPQLNMIECATGKVFLGKEALRLGLCDEIISGDEYIDVLIKTNTTLLRLERVKENKTPLEVFLNPVEVSAAAFFKKMKVLAFHKLNLFLS